MPSIPKVAFGAAAGIGAFSLLLLIISVGIPLWLDDGSGNTVGLFRKCYTNFTGTDATEQGCINDNRATQGGLAIFGLLLLVFSVITAIAAMFVKPAILGLVSLGLLYFASMFVMAAYATWGQYSRDPYWYKFPFGTKADDSQHTSMGSGYHLCVAAHYFLWTALTILAFAVGAVLQQERGDSSAGGQ